MRNILPALLVTTALLLGCRLGSEYSDLRPQVGRHCMLLLENGSQDGTLAKVMDDWLVLRTEDGSDAWIRTWDVRSVYFKEPSDKEGRRSVTSRDGSSEAASIEGLEIVY